MTHHQQPAAGRRVTGPNPEELGDFLNNPHTKQKNVVSRLIHFPEIKSKKSLKIVLKTTNKSGFPPKRHFLSLMTKFNLT